MELVLEASAGYHMAWQLSERNHALPSPIARPRWFPAHLPNENWLATVSFRSAFNRSHFEPIRYSSCVLGFHSVVLALVALGLVIASIFSFDNCLHAKVVLYENAIEVVRNLSRRRLTLDEIAGRQLTRTMYNPDTLFIIPNRPDLPRLKITPPIMQSDAVLEEWLAALADLNAKDAQQAAARYAAFPDEVAADERWGATPAERVGKLRQVQKLVRTLNVCAIAASVWW